MIAANQWPKDKPLPDPEQWLERKLLESTLKEMNYVPTKLDAPIKTQLSDPAAPLAAARLNAAAERLPPVKR